MMTDIDMEAENGIHEEVLDVLLDGDDGDDDEQDEEDFDSSLRDALAEPTSFFDSDATDESHLQLEKTIHTMAATQLCVHPAHSHSFAKVSALSLVGLRASSKKNKCAGCQQALKKQILGSSNGIAAVADPSIVKCMACGALAHRSCALSSSSATTAVEWLEVCPVNGPWVQKAAEAMLVTAEEEDHEVVDDNTNRIEGEEGQEYEINLEDTIGRGGGIDRVRKNSCISLASSEASLATQELDEADNDVQDDDDQDDDDNDSVFGDGEVNLAYSGAPDDGSVVKEGGSTTTPPQLGGQSPGPGRRAISNLLFSKKNSDGDEQNSEDNNNNNSETYQQQEQDGSESAHIAVTVHLPEGDGADLVVGEAADDLSPTTDARKRTWFRNNNNDGPEQQEAEGDPDGQNPDNNKRGWFAGNKRQNSKFEERTAWGQDGRDRSVDPLAPIMAWSSTTNPDTVKEVYGEDAEVSSHIQPDDLAPDLDDDPNNHEPPSSSETAAGRGWFHRRAKSNGPQPNEGENTADAGPEQAPSQLPPSPTPKRFSLFSKMRSQNNVTESEEGKNVMSTTQAAVEEPFKREDHQEVVFSQFLDVEDEEPNGKEQPQQKQHQQQKQKPAMEEDKQKVEEEDTTAQKDSPQHNGESLEHNAYPVVEDKLARKGFGLFRRNRNAEANYEEENPGYDPILAEEEVHFGDSDKSLATDENGNKEVGEQLFDEATAQSELIEGQSEAPGPENPGEHLGGFEDSPGMQDVQLERAEELSRAQSRPKPKTEGEPDQNGPTEDEQVEENVQEGEARPKKRSLLMWRKNTQPTEEQSAGNLSDTAVSKPKEEKSAEVEEAGEASESTQNASQRSFLYRVFTPQKPKAGEVEGDQETVGDDEHAEETSPRRFLRFSMRDVDVPQKEAKPEEDGTAMPEENEKSTPRKFSLFGFRRGAKDIVTRKADNHVLPQAQSWASDEPPSHWTTATTATCPGSPALGEDVDDNAEDENETEAVPLHYANHPFASVSRALQDNILALLSSGEQREILEDTASESEKAQESEGERSPRKPLSSVSLIVSPDSTELSDGGGVGTALGKICQKPMEESTLMKVASGTYEAVKATALAQQKLGTASVAGAIAGGVAGLMFAGPAGAMVGVRYGQTAGALGVVLEGSFTVGVIIAGVSGGRIAADKIQEQLDEQRVLTIGENGVTRKVMLVRPTIHIDPAWHDICAEAQRSSPTSSTSTFSLFSSTSDSIKQDRYERTSDICEEDDIPTDEKVLLLVSRVLSDKGSFPGHVYRCLMQAFRDRCQQRNELRDVLSQDKQDFPHLFDGDAEDSVNMGDEVKVSLSPRARREDTHGVIKYITATLLEVRPGLASTPEITETTASVVEALVFGEIYDLVYEEIAIEATEKDKKLIEKLDDFEFARMELTGMPLCTEEVVSKEAIAALRRLPETHAAVDKLRYCVDFLEKISDHFASASNSSVMGADSLLKMVCQHIIAAKMPYVNAEVAFLEEFARDEQLLRGKEGYALVTLQASLHFLNMSNDFERDIFGQDNDEENVPIVESSSTGGSAGTTEEDVIESKNCTPSNAGNEGRVSELENEKAVAKKEEPATSSSIAEEDLL